MSGEILGLGHKYLVEGGGSRNGSAEEGLLALLFFLLLLGILSWLTCKISQFMLETYMWLIIPFTGRIQEDLVMLSIIFCSCEFVPGLDGPPENTLSLLLCTLHFVLPIFYKLYIRSCKELSLVEVFTYEKLECCLSITLISFKFLKSKKMKK